MPQNGAAGTWNGIEPQVFFLRTALFFGILILLLTPPFQNPDEINHFYRAYQISEGQFTALKENNRVGGFIPCSIKKVTEPFLHLRWNPDAKTTEDTILEAFRIPLDEHSKCFIDFHNTAMYSPVSYLPQVIPVFILRKFQSPPLFIYYATRFVTLLLWSATLYFAIRLTPVFKVLMTFLALLPMSLAVNMSVSADVLTNGAAFLFIACIFSNAFGSHRMGFRNLSGIITIAIILALSKLAYVSLVLLFFLLPVNRFTGRKTYVLYLLILAGAVLIPVVVWSALIRDLYTPYSEYHPLYRDIVDNCVVKGVDMREQATYTLKSGFYIVHVFYNSMSYCFKMYTTGYIGTLGWKDTALPLWLVIASYGGILGIALSEHNKTIVFRPGMKLLLCITFLSALCLLFISQHLTWNVVGGSLVSLLQGRYFIPVFPLLFMLLYNPYGLVPFRIVKPLIMALAVIGLITTVVTLYQRYYVA